MGQAKSRGTLEERKAFAAKRNALLEQQLKIKGTSDMKAYAKKHGIQRLATKLAQAGAPINE